MTLRSHTLRRGYLNTHRACRRSRAPRWQHRARRRRAAQLPPAMALCLPVDLCCRSFGPALACASLARAALREMKNIAHHININMARHLQRTAAHVHHKHLLRASSYNSFLLPHHQRRHQAWRHAHKWRAGAINGVFIQIWRHHRSRINGLMRIAARITHKLHKRISGALARDIAARLIGAS